jgi:hypothetical protein
MPLCYRHNAHSEWKPPQKPLIDTEAEALIDPDGNDPDWWRDWRPKNAISSTRLLVECSGQGRHLPPQPQEHSMTTKKAKPAAKPGIIATIIATISRDRGASKNEILKILTDKFPDRAPESMTRTVGIQAPRQCTSKQDEEKRGRVYYRRGRSSRVSA